jgi:hypothetical protein
MDATGDSPQGTKLAKLLLQPGNVECGEQFPAFCLHQLSSGTSSPGRKTSTSTSTDIDIDIDIDNDNDSQYTAASSARSSIISVVSTAPSSVTSCLNEPDDKLRSSIYRPRTPSFASGACASAASPNSSSSSTSSAAAASAAATNPARSRRNKRELQAARQQRSASNCLPLTSEPKAASPAAKKKRFQRSFSSPADALAAVEPPRDQGLAKMAYAEQQMWISVQQKTFTKWCVVPCVNWRVHVTNYATRLNTKLEARDVTVKDLVKDLSDGVSE